MWDFVIWAAVQTFDACPTFQWHLSTRLQVDMIPGYEYYVASSHRAILQSANLWSSTKIIDDIKNHESSLK